MFCFFFKPKYIFKKSFRIRAYVCCYYQAQVEAAGGKWSHKEHKYRKQCHQHKHRTSAVTLNYKQNSWWRGKTESVFLLYFENLIFSCLLMVLTRVPLPSHIEGSFLFFVFNRCFCCFDLCTCLSFVSLFVSHLLQVCNHCN